MGLAEFMAGVRFVESGDTRGKYSHRQKPINGLRADGAYGFTKWRDQAAAAGLPGANIKDEAAQDRVAANTFRYLFEKYGTWDLVALAWYTNEKTADQAKEGGYREVNQIKNPQVKKYMQDVVNATSAAEADDNPYSSPQDHIPLVGAPMQDAAPKEFRASELMATFVDQMSNKIAGGERTPIEDLAPKIDPTDPAQIAPAEGGVTADGD